MSTDNGLGGLLGGLLGGKSGGIGKILQDLLGGSQPMTRPETQPGDGGRIKVPTPDAAGRPMRAPGAATSSMPTPGSAQRGSATRPGSGKPRYPGEMRPAPAPSMQPPSMPQAGPGLPGVDQAIPGSTPNFGPKPGFPPPYDTQPAPGMLRPAGPKPGLQPGAPQSQAPQQPQSQAPQNGFGDLLERLRKAGLGDQVDSWVGNGPNKPIDASQVTRAVGAQQLSDLAAQAGVSPDEAASGLAKALPEVVNEITPQGVSDQGAVNSNIQRLLGR